MIPRARKRFGQHFLTSTDTIERIVAAIAPQAGQTIVEIGPGRGAITEPIARYPIDFHAIEFDRDLVSRLRKQFEAHANVTIHEADVLQFDFSKLGNALRIVGNLPYNISTPLLFRLLAYEDALADMHFTLQKEVVDRMSAMPGRKNYGRLTIMLACRMEVVPLFDIEPHRFTPAPKVTSSFIRMRPLPRNHFDIHDASMLTQIVKQAFSQRRKTLRNALKGLAETADLEAAGLDPGKRPEEIPVAGWVSLANRLAGTK